ncbi:MAG: AMP-binding protein [bacterium]
MAADYCPFSERLAGDATSGRTVSVDRGHRISLEDFGTLAAGLTRELSDRSYNEWILQCESGLAFAVALMAVWQSGGRVILPPGDRVKAILNKDDSSRGLITDQPEQFETISSLDPTNHEASPSGLDQLDPTACELLLFTSGSSGKPKPIPKTLRHLESEIEVLEDKWGSGVGSSVRVATASHEHIYGLLHKVLWPLSAGHPFEVESHFFPEKLVELIRSHDSVLLVTTPAHLKSFVQYESFPRLRESLSGIVSSGGLLSRETAERVNDTVGLYPLEVFGSTETGGVAWRRQNQTGTNAWTPLDGVRTERSEDGTLLVRSPWVSQPQSGPCDMRDRVEFVAGGKFVLRGRADRVENIADKRVDLEEYEKRVEELEFVEEAAALVTDRERVSSDRKELTLAVVISSESDTNQSSPKEVSGVVRDHLRQFYDSVLLPKTVKFPGELPRNAEGKVTVSQLRKTFD